LLHRTKEGFLMQSSYETRAPRALRNSNAQPVFRIPTLRAAGGAVWRFLGALSQRQAAAEILDLSKSLQSRSPEMAAQMRRAASRSWD
jgi:hypothetical protein